MTHSDTKAPTKSYKHAASVTSQVYFCSAPIRLDAYDTCQLGCVYCFSRVRSRYQASAGIHAANPVAFRSRLERAERGEIASALDEFLAQRVPIQLGGLQDPFTTREEDQGVTLELLKVLRDANYPTLISTKGTVFLKKEYLGILSQMNVVFRISAAGVSEVGRKAVEPGSDSFEKTLRKIELLRERKIPVALRIQPVFPGFEDEALQMASQAAAAGVRQVTFEYLKLTKDGIGDHARRYSAGLGFDLIGTMTNMGLSGVGPDLALSRDAKRPFVRAARAHCHALGLKFGAGDTEFIPWSDGNGCCGSTGFFLERAQQFSANFVGAIKAAIVSASKRVTFSLVEQHWSPRKSIGNYMDWRTRVSADERGDRTDWLAMMARRWNGGRSPYSPSFFDGVVSTPEKDDNGFTIYDATPLARELGARIIDRIASQPSSRE